tara:strand:+ start:4112 stop:4657 length:546 start_codon:yes stop_codon:yes gene_type:complete
MLSSQEAEKILESAEQIYSADIISETVQRMAVDITDTLSDQNPLVLSVTSGAIVFTGQLLPLLKFPLNLDYLHASRYNNKIKGGEVTLKVSPYTNIKDRVVLVLDDILDEGITLASVRKHILENGAKAFYSAVLANKDINKAKSITADFVGFTLPDRYVFGFGMDIYGSWRNLPAIYAVKD